MTGSKLETKLFSRNFDDGWLDILVGAGLALIGLFWMADLVPLGAVIPAVMIPFWKLGRERIVEPRRQSPQFTKTRNARNRRQLGIWFAFGGVVLATEVFLFLMARKMAFMPGSDGLDIIVALPVFLVGVGLLAGLSFRLFRFAGYALFAMAVGLAGIFAHVEAPGRLILVAGIGILLAGLGLLRKFILQFPPMEDGHAR